MIPPEWSYFFQPGTGVVALPNWERPRVLFPADAAAMRWRGTQFFPAFRASARLLRWGRQLRTIARLGLNVRSATDSPWLIEQFVRPVLPDFAWAAVYVGTRGEAQKLTARLFDGGGHILGYLKFAAKPAAICRLRHERFILESLPRGTGPQVFTYGPMGTGEAMVLAPVEGQHPPTQLSPPRSVAAFLRSLETNQERFWYTHPGIAWASYYDDHVGGWLSALGARMWPIVIQHGDLCPWNCFDRGNGAAAGSRYAAIDWEYGTLSGFPHLDLAHYILHSAALIRHLSPARAAIVAARGLIAAASDLSPQEANALVALAAYDAYRKAINDGASPDEVLQQWQRSIWSQQPIRPAVVKPTTPLVVFSKTAAASTLPGTPPVAMDAAVEA